MNIGILGGGNISDTHARAAAAIPGVTVAACYGANRERTAKLAAQHGAAVYGDLDSFLDHPSNTGYPTHGHARGYGLFAANPLGDKQFNEPKSFDFALDAGASVTFKYRILILSEAPSKERIEREALAFAQDTSTAARDR